MINVKTTTITFTMHIIIKRESFNTILKIWVLYWSPVYLWKKRVAYFINSRTFKLIFLSYPAAQWAWIALGRHSQSFPAFLICYSLLNLVFYKSGGTNTWRPEWKASLQNFNHKSNHKSASIGEHQHTNCVKQNSQTEWCRPSVVVLHRLN